MKKNNLFNKIRRKMRKKNLLKNIAKKEIDYDILFNN